LTPPDPGFAHLTPRACCQRLKQKNSPMTAFKLCCFQWGSPTCAPLTKAGSSSSASSASLGAVQYQPKTVLVDKNGECRFANSAADTVAEDIMESRVLHLDFDEGPCPAGGFNPNATNTQASPPPRRTAGNDFVATDAADADDATSDDKFGGLDRSLPQHALVCTAGPDTAHLFISTCAFL